LEDEIVGVSEQLVKERLAALSAKSFDELAALPSGHSEDVVIGGKKLTLSVWHDVLKSGEHQIVVQLYRYFILGWGWMQADGFAVNSRNERRVLKDEELWPFT
jgi:hypothetical protein